MDGVLVGFTGASAGGYAPMGQSFGAVSPEDTLQIETYVSAKDVGLVKVHQPVRLQIDAYSYTQWGTLDGTVESISGDMFGAGGTAPAGAVSGVLFKVVIKPLRTTLRLSNGVQGELRKGMTLNARFLVARRSLLQVLYEDVSAWLDPRANPA